MDEIERYHSAGIHAALRGQWRVIANAPDREHEAAWYAGYDAVPKRMRGSAPKMGPIPIDLVQQT